VVVDRRPCHVERHKFDHVLLHSGVGFRVPKPSKPQVNIRPQPAGQLAAIPPVSPQLQS
jgi:hypothetical protein